MWAHNAALVLASFEDNGRECLLRSTTTTTQSMLVSKSKIQLSNGAISSPDSFFTSVWERLKVELKSKKEKPHIRVLVL